MILELILLAILIGLVTGGKLLRLADLQVKHGWIIFLAVIIYLAGLRLSYVPAISQHRWFFGVMHLTSIAAYIYFMISNSKVLGTKLIVIGLVLNGMAIMANGGFMPASAEALTKVYGKEYVTQTRSAPHSRSSIMNPETRLGALCDIIPIKLPTKFENGVYSVGDMCMTAGIMLAIIMIMRTPLKYEKLTAKEAELDTV